MSLTAGDRLGAYQVRALLGCGGMGEVYRAHDAALGRDVALEVLPDALAVNPESLARFRREAQVLAALNHPNIAAIYGVEEGRGTPALGSSSLKAQRSPTESSTAPSLWTKRARAAHRDA
jgi:serine/threonine protein kinase